MKYVIMCGGQYPWLKEPKWLFKLPYESIVERTIRLLKAQGERDIVISGFHPKLKGLGVPVIQPEYEFTVGVQGHYWVDGFVLMDEPVTYIFGDVVFSRGAIYEIVHSETQDILFYASAAPFRESYMKPWAEPFGFKVVDNDHFKQAIQQLKQYYAEGKFLRHPVAWELWQVIKGTPLNNIRRNYYVINDFTCDVDDKEDLKQMQDILKRYDGWG